MNNLVTADIHLSDNPATHWLIKAIADPHVPKSEKPQSLLIPYQAYAQQRNNARRRGIEFKISFEDWFEIWMRSGHWSKRGIGAGCYCMGRHKDRGAYEVGNVAIISQEENKYKGRSRS
jgi:hypothetical protein